MKIKSSFSIRDPWKVPTVVRHIAKMAGVSVLEHGVYFSVVLTTRFTRKINYWWSTVGALHV